MTSQLIALILVAGLVCLIFWIADRMGLPQPVTMTVKGIAGVIAIGYLINQLLMIA